MEEEGGGEGDEGAEQHQTLGGCLSVPQMTSQVTHLKREIMCYKEGGKIFFPGNDKLLLTSQISRCYFCFSLAIFTTSVLQCSLARALPSRENGAWGRVLAKAK